MSGSQREFFVDRNQSSPGVRVGKTGRAAGLSIALLAMILGPVSAAVAEQVCHLTATGSRITLDVKPRDASDHIAHGDSLGPCIPPQAVVPYTCSSSSIAYQRLFVRSGATPPMKGTMDEPFSSVSAALEYADRKGLAAVEVQVAAGDYGPDSAVITRPSRIVGPGRDAQPTAKLALSIDHRSTHELGIQGLVFLPNGLLPGLTVRTDATAGDPSGHTALCNLGYDQVVGHAVAQLGGSVFAKDIIVANTRRHPDAGFLNVLSGTAFIFGGGLLGDINALLVKSHVFGSEASGIVASGAAASVGLYKVSVSGSQGCHGAVYVSNAAELFGSHVRLGGVRDLDDPLGIEGLDFVAGQPVALTGNRMFGVLARGTTVLAGSDTFVGLYDLVVRNTSVDGDEAEECGFNGASSVSARRGADVVVDQFILDASALIGVQIGMFGSTVILSNGVISNNPIAVNIQDPDFDLNNLNNNVQFDDNIVSLDSEELPVPEPAQDLDSL